MSTGFTGGPAESFEALGREQLAVLLESGLTTSSTVADIGCGALRGGRWIIPVLDRGHYCGVEPNKEMLDRGLRDFIDPDIIRVREPRFSHNDQFDLSEFDMRFSHIIMRSVWTHASKPQIEQSIASTAQHGTADVVLLTSVVPMRDGRRKRPDYKGTEWVGRSHLSDRAGLVAHSPKWIRRTCDQYGLRVKRLTRPPINGQRWLKITRQ